ncbi:glycoside hydrolase family 18 protein [Amniculicola lignicola CBS 123094]|uniref:Glycoside hydrolase family 18 protein n=1 Tax=Amniculicola lignicola CBS 123094 TaxID=1392246 RepID=A0A6A5W9K9_9PLEO|nr:glycoside hydrolase family 18 protein [Amniculicola lignicola CBS 123094]
MAPTTRPFLLLVAVLLAATILVEAAVLPHIHKPHAQHERRDPVHIANANANAEPDPAVLQSGKDVTTTLASKPEPKNFLDDLKEFLAEYEVADILRSLFDDLLGVGRGKGKGKGKEDTSTMVLIKPTPVQASTSTSEQSQPKTVFVTPSPMASVITTPASTSDSAKTTWTPTILLSTAPAPTATGWLNLGLPWNNETGQYGSETPYRIPLVKTRVPKSKPTNTATKKTIRRTSTKYLTRTVHPIRVSASNTPIPVTGPIRYLNATATSTSTTFPSSAGVLNTSPPLSTGEPEIHILPFPYPIPPPYPTNTSTSTSTSTSTPAFTPPPPRPPRTSNLTADYVYTPLLPLRQICTNPSIKTITLPLLDAFYGPNAYPTLHHFPGCSAPNPSQTLRAPGLLNCTVLGAEVARCQRQGRKVLLSVKADGAERVGGNTEYGTPGEEILPFGPYFGLAPVPPNGSTPEIVHKTPPNLFDARHPPSSLALLLFSLFGAGHSERADLRPLGPDQPNSSSGDGEGIRWVGRPLGEEVVLDGFDVQVPGEWRGMWQEAGWRAFVERLRELGEEAENEGEDGGAEGKGVVVLGWVGEG